MTDYGQTQTDDNTNLQDDSLIGIGEIQDAPKKERISPHIRYDDQMTRIEDELSSEITVHNKNSVNSEEGELAIDVYETADYIHILAPVAGVKIEDVELSITEDVLQIRGKRSLGKEVPPQNYLIRECFWGNFSRSIILPPDADPVNISATFKNAVLKNDTTLGRIVSIP